MKENAALIPHDSDEQPDAGMIQDGEANFVSLSSIFKHSTFKTFQARCPFPWHETLMKTPSSDHVEQDNAFGYHF